MQTRGAVRLNRIQPALGPEAFKSYSLLRPLRTHWRQASCEEIRCNGWRFGWATHVDVSTEMGPRQYDYLTHDKTRKFSVQKTGPTTFTFSYGPGYTCFAAHEHRIQVDRPALCVVREGDWRGNPRRSSPLVYRNIENWADDFATHQAGLNRATR